MFSLFGMFFWVSVFCFPLYIILAGNGVQALRTMPRYVLNQYSLGNLGGSSVSCGSSALGTGRLALSCFAGVMSGPDVQFGIVSKSIFPKQFCREEAIWEHTKANQHNFSQSSHCSDYMDKKIIFDRFQKTCHGKADC